MELANFDLIITIFSYSITPSPVEEYVSRFRHDAIFMGRTHPTVIKIIPILALIVPFIIINGTCSMRCNGLHLCLHSDWKSRISHRVRSRSPWSSSTIGWAICGSARTLKDLDLRLENQLS